MLTSTEVQTDTETVKTNLKREREWTLNEQKERKSGRIERKRKMAFLSHQSFFLCVAYKPWQWPTSNLRLETETIIYLKCRQWDRRIERQKYKKTDKQWDKNTER